MTQALIVVTLARIANVFGRVQDERSATERPIVWTQNRILLIGIFSVLLLIYSLGLSYKEGGL